MKVSTCEFCGQEFEWRGGKQRFCSQACKIMWHKENKFKQLKVLAENRTQDGRKWDAVVTPGQALEYVLSEQTCPVCGQKFIPRRVTQRTCGKGCSQTYYAMRDRAKKRPHLDKMVKCAECGKEFKAVRSDSKFCSKACRKKSTVRNLNQWHEDHKYGQGRHIQTTTFVCKVCGKSFTPKNMNQKCCSVECSAEHYRQFKETQNKGERKVGKYKKRCKWCGKEFYGRTDREQYCSHECAYSYNQRKLEMRYRDLYPIRKCVECGKEFQPKRKDQVRCSHECVMIAREKFANGVWKANGNINIRVQKKRDALIEKVENREDREMSQYDQMMRMSPDELREAYDRLSATQKKEFERYYYREHRLQKGSGIVKRMRKQRSSENTSEWHKRIEAMKEGRGYTPEATKEWHKKNRERDQENIRRYRQQKKAEKEAGIRNVPNNEVIPFD